MKAVAMCPTCLVEGGPSARPPPLSGELDDAGYIHVRCDKGHDGIVVYDARRYEVLIKSAARAYVDGYTNEVVAVMSAALERSYEFYIRVSCRAKGVEPDAVDKAWKNISSQSERQFGAFQFLFLIDQGEVFKLDPTITETRNGVVHKGRIAREAEATDFAEKVYSVIRKLESIVREKFPGHAKSEATREVARQVELIPPDVPHVTMKVTTVIVNKEKNEVMGTADRFLDHAGAVLQSRSQGWPE